MVRTLKTHDRAEALRRRDQAQAAIVAEINVRLAAIGLPSLHGDWCPPWASDEALVSEALTIREQIAQASNRPDAEEEEHHQHGGSLVPVQRPVSPQDRLISTMKDVVSDRVDELREKGRSGAAYGRRFLEIALGPASPFGLAFARWEKERDKEAGPATRMKDRSALNTLARFVVARSEPSQVRERESPKGRERSQAEANRFLESVPLDHLDGPLLGQFAEWLADDEGLSPATIQARISSLKVFWDWAILKKLTPGPNPWDGATKGLKRRARRAERGKPKLRPYAEEELIALLKADPDEGRSWAWGRAIREITRLALLTGVRQNELCSLTAGRVITDQGPLWGIAVTEDEAKTTNSIRSIPLHPLISPIIERRLAEATLAPTAPLFPECRPGPAKNGSKRSHYFSQRFTDFRRTVLGRETDDILNFHSFRRNFISMMEAAFANGAQSCTPLVRR